MSTCHSCKAPVVWVETEATAEKPGRKMPLDACPDGQVRRVSNGNLVLTGSTTGDGTPIVRFQRSGPHRSHFATCPNAKEHRR